MKTRTHYTLIAAILVCSPFASLEFVTIVNNLWFPETPALTTWMTYAIPFAFALIIGLGVAGVIMPYMVRNNMRDAARIFGAWTFSERLLVGTLCYYVLMFIWGLADIILGL